MDRRDVLICTVGTSLLTNIGKSYDPASGVSAEIFGRLQEAWRNDHLAALLRLLLEIEPTSRICGAEINSIEDALRNKSLGLRHLFLFVSDTADGRKMGDLLARYYRQREDLDLETSTFVPVEKLQDENPKDFKTHGLRNLVREMGRVIQRYTSERIVINATGGYKAQIAIAVVVGQTLGIPVLYRHERFSEIVDFPPMPVTFDYSLLGENSALLTDFERGKAFSLTEIGELDERLRVLLEEVEVDGEPLFELGAIGQIFVLGYRQRLSKPHDLPPADEQKKRPPRFSEHHYPKGFKDFVTKVWQETPWIVTAESCDYSGQKGIKGVGFQVRGEELFGTYQDRDNFGGRFKILTTATSLDGLIWAADQLNQKYREW
ncbi:MAG: hypothetical protein KatS3mg051_0591 [Anaerolineae bacterium]|nr:MAG: hypothetical protein KatS3mg051_0591 [Anaerolineae bacterium]